jgi:excisionase family DNA binding protein
MSPEELSDELGIPLSTIYNWRWKGEGPRAHKMGRHVRYKRTDVEDWAATRAETPRPAS